MGRKTSGQTVGLETIGNVQASASTLTTTQANQDLTLDPNGTGGVLVNGDVTIADQGDLRLREAVGNGTNYIAQQAASNMASNYTITWPSAVASSSGYVLSSDTSGNLSWVSSGGTISVTDGASSTTVHYPFFGTSAGSIPTTLVPLVKSSLSFVPNSGELSATAFKGADLYGSTANSGTLTLRGTTSATKATASVLMSDGVASTSTTTGSLVVTGGVGVSGRINAANVDAILGANTANTARVSSLTITALTTIGGIFEYATVSATSASSTVNIDVVTNSVWYYTAASGGNWTLNIRGNSSTTLDSIVGINQSCTVTFLVTNSTAYRQTGFTVDGNAVTPKWLGGSAPSSGSSSAVDMYTVTLIKTASNTWTCFESFAKFA